MCPPPIGARATRVYERVSEPSFVSRNADCLKRNTPAGTSMHDQSSLSAFLPLALLPWPKLVPDRADLSLFLSRLRSAWAAWAPHWCGAALCSPTLTAGPLPRTAAPPAALRSWPPPRPSPPPRSHRTGRVAARRAQP
eukprot:3538223-Pleurochrysis_carterae.AAC.1